MTTLVFHKSLVTLTNVREINVELITVTDLFLFIKNLIPELTSLENSYTFLVNGEKPIPKSWVYQNEILDLACTIWVVPVIYGKFESIATFVSTITTTFLQVAVATAINFLLSKLITQLLPKPKRNEEQDASVRSGNDIFSSIVNTIDSGTTIPLNYGMPRIGGHYLSADIETVTIPKPTQPIASPPPSSPSPTDPPPPPSDPYNPCLSGYELVRDREGDYCVPLSYTNN